MSRICIFALLSCLAALPGRAEDLRTFAICAGRLSALMEHQWVMQEPGSEQTQRQRDAFVDLVAALAPAGPQAMALRLEAKVATAEALRAATFRHQPQARLRVEALVRACLRLLPQA